MKKELVGISPSGRYTPKQAMDALGVCRSTLYTYCNNGLLKYKVSKANGRRVFMGIDIMGLWNALI